MFAILALIVALCLACMAAGELEDGFLPGVFIYGLLSVVAFVLFFLQIQS